MKFISLVNSLILGSKHYDTVSTPEQAAVAQYNVDNFFGGAGPYMQYPGFGVSPETPGKILQVQYIGRHGERFPTKGSGPSYGYAIGNLTSQTLNGSLAFLNGFTYFVDDASNYEQETTMANSGSIYAGSLSAVNNGETFRAKYGSLYNPNMTLPVFSSNSRRCYDTSVNFIEGFQPEGEVKHYIIDEDGSMGANSLTPRYGCNKYVNGTSDETFPFNDYLKDVLKRLKVDNPNLNLTTGQVSNLFDACAYEMNVKGYSTLAEMFTLDEWVKYEYANDLDLYYSLGPGNNVTETIGSVFVRASLKLLQDDDNDNQIWLGFTHDSDVVTYYSGLRLFGQKALNKTSPTYKSDFIKSKIIPQSTRTILEKFEVDDEIYVRFIVNDAVMPFDDCNTGPGFSCALDDYINMMEDKLTDYDQYCENNITGVPQEVSFYWDYNTTTYNASLMNS